MTSQPISAPPVLGELRAEYRSGMPGLIVVFLLLTALPIWAGWMSLNATPPNLTGLLFCALGALLFISLAATGLFRIPRRILLYDDGMQVEWLFKRGWLAWEAITAAKAPVVHIHGSPMLQLYVRTSDGRTIAFGDMPSSSRPRSRGNAPRIVIHELVDIVLEQSAPARSREALRRYDSGQVVDFKQLQISRAGIGVKDRVLSWPMVADIQAAGPFMVVRAVGQEQPWRTFALQEALNLDILPALIGHAQGERFSAFQEGAPQPDLEQAVRIHRQRRRVVNWLLVPLLLIGLNGGWIYYRYYTGYQGHRDRGEVAFDRGEYDSALAEFDRAVALEPDYHDGYVNRGRAYAELGRYAEATVDYTTAMRLNPNGYRAIAQQARVLHYQGHFAEAIELFNAALERVALTPDPVYPFAYCGRGESFQRLGRLDAARADYTTCRDTATDAARRAEAERLLAGLPQPEP